jgi:hypothetical protein
MPRLRMSAHAWKRLSQRNLTLSDLLIAIDRGQRIHRAHACFYFLGSRNLPANAEPELQRLVGTTVVVENNEIVTAYRNKHAASKIKRKGKRYHGEVLRGRRAISVGGRVAMAARA